MRVTNNLQFVIILIKKSIFMITLKVEKENSELKDCLLAPKLYSRGKKTIFDLKHNKCKSYVLNPNRLA